MSLSTHDLTVTHIPAGGMAFGITDDGVAVYIPKRVASASAVSDLARYTAHCVPNGYHPDKAPLMALALLPLPRLLAAAVPSPASTLEPLLTRVAEGMTTPRDAAVLRELLLGRDTTKSVGSA